LQLAASRLANFYKITFFIFFSLEVSLRTSALIPSDVDGIRDSKGLTQRIWRSAARKVYDMTQLIFAELILRGA